MENIQSTPAGTSTPARSLRLRGLRLPFGVRNGNEHSHLITETPILPKIRRYYPFTISEYYNELIRETLKEIHCIIQQIVGSTSVIGLGAFINMCAEDTYRFSTGNWDGAYISHGDYIMDDLVFDIMDEIRGYIPADVYISLETLSRAIRFKTKKELYDY